MARSSRTSPACFHLALHPHLRDSPLKTFSSLPSIYSRSPNRFCVALYRPLPMMIPVCVFWNATIIASKIFEGENLRNVQHVKCLIVFGIIVD